MEFAFLFFIWLLAGIGATWAFEFVLKTNKKLRKRYYWRHNVVWGYHIHHSLYGLLFIAINLVLFIKSPQASDLFYSAFGIGIIIMHTISDPKRRLVFIEKQR